MYAYSFSTLIEYYCSLKVANWFSNARRRLKNTVNDPKKSWSYCITHYNSCLDSNAELMSNSSENSTLESSDNEVNPGRTYYQFYILYISKFSSFAHCFTPPIYSPSYLFTILSIHHLIYSPLLSISLLLFVSPLLFL